ncbi:hypothetical protein Tco_1024719, partial [Tanacetum coccineum]
MESSVQFICVFCGSLSDEYGCRCSTCKLCGNDAHYGYDCPSQVLFIYNQDPCLNQNLDNFPQTSPSFPQQYLCCKNCGGPHATFQCQPMNQSFYNSNSPGFDQIQPPQYSVVHQSTQETDMEMLQAREDLMEAIQVFLKKYDHIPPKEKCMALLLAEERFLKVKQAFKEEQNQPEIIQELLLQLIHDLQRLGEIQPKQAEEKGINKATSSPIEEPKDSLIMEDEDINTILEKESDKENESSVENLFHIPSESKVTFDNESECDLPVFDDSPLDVFKDNCVFFYKPLFDSYGDTTSSEYSSDNESILEEDVFSNLPSEFDKEYISSDVNIIYDEEFAGELALINPIPPRIAGADSYPEGDIRLVEKLLNDNSSHRTPDELNSEDIIEFFFAFPIPVEDSYSLLEKTNTILSYLDDSLPELETFSFDVEEKNSGSTTTHADISLPKYDSFHFDLSDTSL